MDIFLVYSDVVQGLLKEELLISSIYVSELESKEYASKVHNSRTYQIVSNDVANRWADPFIPMSLPKLPILST